jgi:hypothetical protein
MMLRSVLPGAEMRPSVVLLAVFFLLAVVL